MKLARAYLIFLYLTLIGSIVFPMIVTPLLSDTATGALSTFKIVLIASVYIILWIITVILEIISIIKGLRDKSKIIKLWKRLKLGAIPFYVINFIIIITFSTAFFPISIISDVLNCIMCIVMIIISGIAGVASVKNSGFKSKAHYILQFIPVLDVISTLIINKKLKKEKKAVAV